MELSQLRAKVRQDIAMEEEQTITQSELTEYINKGIRVAERIIHNLYEDYFLTTSSITVHPIAANPFYSLPTDIFANKIRKLVYDDGSNNIYNIKRIRKVEQIHNFTNFTGVVNNNLNYIILNHATHGPIIRLLPTPTVDPTANIYLYYIRRSKQLALDTDESDIPEFLTFVIAYAKLKCLMKDPTSPLMQGTMQEVEVERQQMVDTLTNMVPDDDDFVLADASFYDDFEDC